jgi:tripartite-type tricarboxylate transporter receptor subunit TctC
MISRKTFLHSAGRAALALLGAEWLASAHADTYPARPVRWIVPYTAGGATDVLSRLICQRLSERLGQPFVVENKPGAGSNIGTQAVIASPPDGYTLLLTSTANAINASFDPSLPFDFAKGITPVAGVARIPLVLVVNNDLPVRNIAEFIAYAKANPGKLSIASSGIGNLAASLRRIVQVDGRDCLHPPALSRLGPGPDRRDERPDPGHVRQRHLLL